MMALIDDPEHDLSVGREWRFRSKMRILENRSNCTSTGHEHPGPERRGPAGKQKEEDQSPRSTAGILVISRKQNPSAERPLFHFA